MRRSALLRRLVLSTAVTALVGSAGPIQAATCTWNGGPGDWGVAASWSCGVVPGSGDVVRIDANPAIASLVTVTSGQSASTLTLDSGDQIAITNGSLAIYGGSLANAGTIAISANSALIGRNGTTAITGNGIITLDNSTSVARLYGDGSNMLTIGSGQTVTGAGEVGLDNGAITNNGVINANLAGRTLTLDARGGPGGNTDGTGLGTYGAGLANTNLLEATNGGTLLFQSGLYDNTGGTIQAVGTGGMNQASTVTFNDGTSIVGGNLTTSGGGVIAESGNGTQYLTDVTLTNGSSLTVNNDYVRIGDTLANNGSISLANNGNLIGNSPMTTIAGTGTITLDNSTSVARLYGDGTNKLTIGSGQTVTGAGEIGLDNGAITNNGVIDANLANRTLVLDARGGAGGNTDGSGLGTYGAGLVNANLLEATNGGTLLFQSGVYDNTGGTIQAVGASALGRASTVTFNDGASIVGGTLVTSGGGVIAESGNGTQYLTDVTLTNGSSLTVNNDYVRIGNTLTNNGSISLANNGNLIGNSASTTITGTGTIALDNATSVARIYGDGANKLTIGSGQTITGAGEVGLDNGAVTNNGVIDANLANRTLVLDARGGAGGNSDMSGVGTGNTAGLLNNNLLEATNGGTLLFQSGVYQNGTNGVIQAVGASALGRASTVVFNDGASIVGGTLTTSGGGVIAESGNGTQYLTDVTLTNGSSLTVNNDYVRIGNTLTNNGSISLANNGNLIGNSPANTITGTGTIALDNATSVARIYGDGANKLTIGSGQTVTGAGEIGLDNGAVTNNGVVNANLAGRTLVLDARGGSGGNTDMSGVGTNNAAGLLNNNLIEATNGGALLFQSGTYQNGASGVIQAIGQGSTVTFNNDASIVGGTLVTTGGGIIAESGNGTQYLTDVTLTNGSNLSVNNDYVRIGNGFTNNGTVALANNGNLIGNSPTNTIAGNGTITLDNSTSVARLYGDGANKLTIGSGQTVTGAGEIGLDAGAVTNRGAILAGGTITLDARGGGGGNTDGTGVGTGNLAGFLNDGGTVGTTGAGTITLLAGLYQNSATGTFSAGAGGLLNMAGDANLTNLQSGGVLSQGNYTALTGGTVNLRSDQTGSIVTIGTGHAGTDTIVTLSGAGSTLEVTPRSGGATVTIDQSLQSIAQSGELILSNGRTFAAPGGSFANAGTLALDSGARFSATGLANSGLVTGNGTLATPVTNSGSVVASGGTLASMAITGDTGTIQSNAGATLNLAGAGGPSTAGFLVNNGSLALGGNDVTVTSDYQNANFGAGSSFNARANVTGSGLILAASATMDLSGPGLTGSTLNVGNVRLGDSSSTTLTITNNGTLTTLRGAVESPVTNTVNISSSNFVVGPNGGNTSVQLSYTGTQAGSLQGQTITVANNFDNVADRTLQITGAAYNPAAASLSPNPIDLGATRTGGTLSGTVTIANTAPVGAYSEKLAVTGASGSGGASGTAPAGLIAAGSSAGSTVMLSTATSGTKSGTVTYALATDGTGTSGLAQAALPSQAVTVNGKVYQVADPQLASGSVTFATVRQGSTAPTATLGISNAANGALNDSLSTQVTSTPAAVTATAPGSLAGGRSGAVTFTENTGTAGVFSGTAQFGFTSTDPDLAPLALASQSVGVGGTVTQLAAARLFLNTGMGTFAGSGSDYTLDFGPIMAGTGSVRADLGVLNTIMNTAYGETLGGMFGSSGGTGYNFAGMTFSGLAGGNSDVGNLLTFDTTGLGNGTYTDILTLSDYSRYAGLSDMTLAPIRVTVTAQITGAGTGVPGAVPEPGTWGMLVLGFGALGAAMRRRRSAPVMA